MQSPEPLPARAVHCGRTLGDADVVERFRQAAMGPAPNRNFRTFWQANGLPGAWRAKIDIEARPSPEFARRIAGPDLERLAATERDGAGRAGQRR